MSFVCSAAFLSWFGMFTMLVQGERDFDKRQHVNMALQVRRSQSLERDLDKRQNVDMALQARGGQSLDSDGTDAEGDNHELDSSLQRKLPSWTECVNGDRDRYMREKRQQLDDLKTKIVEKVLVDENLGKRSKPTEKVREGENFRILWARDATDNCRKDPTGLISFEHMVDHRRLTTSNKADFEKEVQVWYEKDLALATKESTSRRFKTRCGTCFEVKDPNRMIWKCPVSFEYDSKECDATRGHRQEDDTGLRTSESNVIPPWLSMETRRFDNLQHCNACHPDGGCVCCGNYRKLTKHCALFEPKEKCRLEGAACKEAGGSENDCPKELPDTTGCAVMCNFGGSERNQVKVWDPEGMKKVDFYTYINPLQFSED